MQDSAADDTAPDTDAVAPDTPTSNPAPQLERLRCLDIEALKAGLSSSDAFWLAHLAKRTDREGITRVRLNTISREFGLVYVDKLGRKRTTGTVGRAIQRAEKLGLVIKIPDPTDHRRFQWLIPLMVAPLKVVDPNIRARARSAYIARQERAPTEEGIEEENKRGWKKRADRGGAGCGYPGCQFAQGTGWLSVDPDCPKHRERFA